jgi:hypothetical protein
MKSCLKLILTPVILWLVPMITAAQEENSGNTTFSNRNIIDLELLGPGGLYSVNYERLILNRSRQKSAIRVGAGIVTEAYCPVTYNHLFSFSQHHLELGIGVVFIIPPDAIYDMRALSSFNLGYRFQKPDGKFLFKALYTPMFELEKYNPNFLPIWIGMTFGYCF